MSRPQATTPSAPPRPDGPAGQADLSAFWLTLALALAFSVLGIGALTWLDLRAGGDEVAPGERLWTYTRRTAPHLLGAALVLATLSWKYALARGRRLRAMQALRDSQQRYEAITDSVPEAILTLDERAHVVSWNRAAADIFGLRGRRSGGFPLHWLLRSGIPQRFEELLALPPGEHVDATASRLDGSEVPLELSVGRWTDEQGTHVSLVGRDISARRQVEQAREQLEDELLHARKLEAVGQLAAGIAHEINTPTQFVGDNTRFLKEAFDDLQGLMRQSAQLVEELEAAGSSEQAERLRTCLEDADVDFLEEEIPRALEQSLEGLEHVTRIVVAMKDFAHPGAIGKVSTDLNQCVRSTATVATNEWRYACELELDLADELPLVICNAGEINQVLLNLIVNAAHAVAEAVGEEPDHKGTIRIATRPVDDSIELCISDDGSGIPEELQPRVFEPFFTTKGVGKGTGQGLATAYDVVVHKHQGSLSVESEPGVGTTFTLRLPLRPQELAQGPSTAPTPELAP